MTILKLKCIYAICLGGPLLLIMRCNVCYGNKVARIKFLWVCNIFMFLTLISCHRITSFKSVVT